MWLMCLCVQALLQAGLHALLLQPNWRVFSLTLQAQVRLEGGLPVPAAVAEAMVILLNQILQELIAKRGQ